MTKGAFDSQNVAFWSASEQCYALYLRTWTGGGFAGFRTISRATSTDFLEWSAPVEMSFGDTPREHLYTSHDEDDATGFKMIDWRLYSSTDMVNWTDRGAVASLKTFPWAVQSNDAWAPQVIERGGKFYLYVPVSVAGSPKNVIAVAVADRPDGPFVDALGHPLVGPADGFIDPTVAIDDDGQAYLYWGNPDLWYVRLNKDMISYSGTIEKIAPRIGDYQEGPWFYNRRGKYYMAFASTCCPERPIWPRSPGPAGPRRTDARSGPCRTTRCPVGRCWPPSRPVRR